MTVPSPFGGGAITLPLLNTRHRALVPCHKSARATDCFQRVTPRALMRLLDDGGASLPNEVQRVEILDCRFPYEYDGGHIHGARNLCAEDEVDSYFATLCEQASNQEINPKNTVFIFHCEFSSKRGPRLAKHFRSVDRQSNADEVWNFGSPARNSGDTGETTTAKKRRKESNTDTPPACDPSSSASRDGASNGPWTPVTRKLCDDFDSPSPMVLPRSGNMGGLSFASSPLESKEFLESNTQGSGSFSPILKRSFSTPVFSPPRHHSPCPVSTITALTRSPLPVFRLPASQMLNSSTRAASEKTLSKGSSNLEVKVSEISLSHDSKEVLRTRALSASPMTLCSPLKSSAVVNTLRGFGAPASKSRSLTPCSKSSPLPETQSSKQAPSASLHFPRPSQNVPAIYSKGLFDDVPQKPKSSDSTNKRNVHDLPSPCSVSNPRKRKRPESKHTNHPDGNTYSSELPPEVIARTKALTITVSEVSEQDRPSIPPLSSFIPSKKFKPQGLAATTAVAPRSSNFAMTSPSMSGPDPGITFPQVYILEGGYRAFYEEAVRITQVPRYCKPPAYVPMDTRDLPSLLRRARSMGSELAVAQSRHGPRRAAKRRVRVNSRLLFSGIEGAL